MFVRSELKRRAKEVLSNKYLKLFIAALILHWLYNGVSNFKIFSVNFNFSIPTMNWLDAMTITLFGQTYVGLRSLGLIFGSMIFFLYAVGGGGCGFDSPDRDESAELWFDELYQEGVDR